MIAAAVARRLDLDLGRIAGGTFSCRFLGDLRGSFADRERYEEALARGNPLIYSVSTLESAAGDGDLSYGLGVLMPGKIGREYFLTKGHLHAWREAAEVYVGLRGHGLMLLEDEQSGESKLLPLSANEIVYVPGHTAHRTINIGTVPLVYLGVYPANAGHDYGAIGERNFRNVVIEEASSPALRDRMKL